MNNPFTKETAMSKIRTKVGGKKKVTEESVGFGAVKAYLVGMNNAIPICATASACCWDKPIPEDYQGIADYVGRRSKTGHTSILEHSNFVAYLKVAVKFALEFVDFLTTVKYLNTFSVMSNDGTYWHFIIGGSYRGFTDLYKEAEDLNNPVLQAITALLYQYGNSAAFEDICAYELLDKDLFQNLEPDENFKLLSASLPESANTELFEVIGMDSIKKLYTNLYSIEPEIAEKITTFDLIKFVSITILFKNMSRTCTHQLVRHRNGITQESQRYVDYSKGCFSSPALFKPDKYDATHKYNIRFGASSPMHLTLDEIGDAICKIYEQLQNPVVAGQEHHLLKEDARAFLPGNVQCRKIYMTFTVKSFLMFLHLREDKHAQAEIRMYAQAVGDWFRSISRFNTKELCDLYTNPRLLIEDPFNFMDEDLGIVDETFEVTDEEYEQAAGIAPDGTEEEDFERVVPNKDNEV